MSLSYWQDLPQNFNLNNHSTPIEVDIAIVGAGISGLSTAYWLLTEYKDLRVAIIDRGSVGVGASGRNAGFIISGLAEHFDRTVSSLGRERALDVYQLSIENHKLTQSIIKKYRIDCDYRQNGSYRVTNFEPEKTVIEENFELLKECGINCEYLKSAEVNNRLSGQHFLNGIYFKEDADFHPIKYLVGLARILIENGLVLCTGAEVESIVTNNEGVELKTQKFNIKANRLVLATNAFTSMLRPSLKAVVSPVRGQMLATEPYKAVLWTEPIYANFGFDYWKQTPDLRVIFGGRRHLGINQEFGFEDEPTFFLQNRIEAYMYEQFPQLKGLKITHRWAGIMGYTPDGFPLVGALPGEDLIFHLSGFNGHGNGYSLICARALTRLLVDGGHLSLPDFFSIRAAHRSKLFLS